MAVAVSWLRWTALHALPGSFLCLVRRGQRKGAAERDADLPEPGDAAYSETHRKKQPEKQPEMRPEMRPIPGTLITR